MLQQANCQWADNSESVMGIPVKCLVTLLADKHLPLGHRVYGLVQCLTIDSHVVEVYVLNALQDIGFGHILK